VRSPDKIDGMEWRQVDDETLIHEFGPPLFVPIGLAGAAWSITGIARGPTAAHTIHVRTSALPSAIQVDTSIPRRTPSLGFVVSNVIHRAIPPDVTLPFTITVAERRVDLAVDGQLVPFQVVEAADSWWASATIGGRLVEISASALAPEEIELRQVSDLTELTSERLPQHRHGGVPQLRAPNVAPPPGNR
jgi:hypothetical protein